MQRRTYLLDMKIVSGSKENTYSTFSNYGEKTPKISCSRLRLKCDDTRAETRFRLSANRTSPLKSAGASVQSTIAHQR